MIWDLILASAAYWATVFVVLYAWHVYRNW